MAEPTDTLDQKTQEEIDALNKKAAEKGPYTQGQDKNPRRRGAVLINIFGDKEKKRRAIDLGLSDLILPPITRKSVATYRTVNQSPINPATKQEADPKTIILPGTYKLYDWGEADFTKRWKIMKNTREAGEINIDPITKRQVIDEVIEPVILMNGIKKVEVERYYREYVFMELHPLNGSYRKRDNSLMIKFVRTDLETNKSSAFRAAEMDLGLQAELEILKMTKDEVVGFATTAAIPTYEGDVPRPITDVKSDLRAFARKDPRKFYSMANNVEAAVKMNVLDIISLGLIEYEPDKKRYVVPYTDEPIHVHTVSEDPTESLVKHLLKEENSDLYQAIINLREYWK